MKPMTTRIAVAAVTIAAAFGLGADTVQWKTGTEFNVDRDGENLPLRTNDVLDILISANKSFLVNAAGASIGFDGTIVITNRTASYAHPGVLLYRVDREFSGAGTIITDAIRIDTGVKLTYGLKSLKVGYGIMENSNTTAAKYEFPSGIEFGAWGDWSNRPAEAVSMVDVHLAGDVSFDTLDCFDGVNVHTITLGEITDTGMTSLSASGGGTVTLTIAGGFASELRRLEVGAGTTLDLTGVGKQILTRSLVVGAGAVLRIDASKCPLEVTGSQTVDPTARIEVSVSGSLAAGSLHHVFDSTGGLPSGVLVCDAPAGWDDVATGGSVYLSDGSMPEFPYTSSVYAWLGGESSSWKDAANWTKGAVPAGGFETYFARVANEDVVYDYAGSYAGQLRSLVFDSSCGPYVFSGGQLKPSYGSASSQSVKSESAFPVVISNFMACASDPGGCFLNNGGSFVALVGGGSSKGSLRYRGDVRLGGTWTVTNLIEMANRPAGSRESQLTVLKDGTLDMSGKTGALSLPSSLRVDGTLVLGAVTAETPVSIDGTLRAGSGFAFGEALMAQVEGGWTRLATAASFQGFDSVLRGYATRIVPVGNGLFALEARAQRGLVILFR